MESPTSKTIDILLLPGERGLLVGQAGSGKTYAAAWMLRHTQQRAVIFDTKTEPVFLSVARGRNTIVVHSRAEMMKALDAKNTRDRAHYIIVRPPPSELSDPMSVDAYLESIYHAHTNLFVFIDEAYQLHRNSQAGPGLIGLLTRGRARGLTTLVATQRPAWLSRFALTEANKFYIFRLTDRRDWQRLGEIVPGIPKEGIMLPKHRFIYHEQGDDRVYRMAPLPMVADLGYTPQIDAKPERRWY